MNIILGVFFVLHGLVHLLYAGQSLRFFELRPGMTWPDNSWLFSKLLGDPATRSLCAVSLGLVTIGFLASGLGLIFRLDWWRPFTIATTGFSSLIFILFWDGRFLSLDDKGGVGLLINLVVLGVVLVLKLPV